MSVYALPIYCCLYHTKYYVYLGYSNRRHYKYHVGGYLYAQVQYTHTNWAKAYVPSVPVTRDGIKTSMQSAWASFIPPSITITYTVQ